MQWKCVDHQTAACCVLAPLDATRWLGRYVQPAVALYDGFGEEFSIQDAPNRKKTVASNQRTYADFFLRQSMKQTNDQRNRGHTIHCVRRRSTFVNHSGAIVLMNDSIAK